MKRAAAAIAVLALLGALALLVARKNHLVAPQTEMQKETRFLMDTPCSIQIPGPASCELEIKKAFDRLAGVDRKFNCQNPESPVYQFNETGEPIRDPEIVALIQKSLDVCRASGGALDITIYPVVELWGFHGGGTPHVPAEPALQTALKKVSWKQLVVTNGVVTKTAPDVKLDLGAVAKGYGVGEAMKVLKSNGIRDALIDAGGDIYAMGHNRGRPWKIGVRHPRGQGIFCALDTSDRSLATSGDYERFFEENGRRYHHIFDPATGYPATNLISVTILGDDATLADAYSTAVFVMGAEKGIDFVENSPHTEAILVTPSGRVLVTPGLKKAVPIERLDL